MNSRRCSQAAEPELDANRPNSSKCFWGKNLATLEVLLIPN